MIDDSLSIVLHFLHQCCFVFCFSCCIVFISVHIHFFGYHTSILVSLTSWFLPIVSAFLCVFLCNDSRFFVDLSIQTFLYLLYTVLKIWHTEISRPAPTNMTPLKKKVNCIFVTQTLHCKLPLYFIDILPCRALCWQESGDMTHIMILRFFIFL